MEVIAAFDIGDRRIGVAFSDPFGEYAIPSDTYFRTGNLREDARAIAALAEGRGASRIVCGLPLNADGTESEQTLKTRKFVAALQELTSLPVEFEDERYTTRAARNDLNAMGISVKKDKKKKAVDSLAAAYILESRLARAKKELKMKEEREDYDEENSVVELVDEEGNKTRFEHIMTFEYKGEWYAALTPEREAVESEEEEDDEIAIFRIAGEEDDETLEQLEDEALLDEVFAEFCRQYEDFEDADEAAMLDSDGDDEE